MLGMANALKKLRAARGWTHDLAAERMGISRGQFIKLERGERGLTERTIALAAKAFGVPPAEVIGDDEPDDHEDIHSCLRRVFEKIDQETTDEMTSKERDALLTLMTFVNRHTKPSS